MPKQLSEQALNQVKYVSMTDYIRHVDELDSIEDIVAYSTRYLLSYGEGVQRDVSLAEAIHIAKLKIADASAAARKDRIMVPEEAVDPDLSDEQDAPNRLFMMDPTAYLQNEATRLLMQAAFAEQFSPEDEQRLTNYQAVSAVLSHDVNQAIANEVHDLDIEPNARDVKARMTALFGGAKQFKDAYDGTKPSFFAWLFNKSSRAYHNLDQAYEAFNNPNHANYGNMNALDKAATEYLKHCFPNWDPKRGGISKSAIERFSGTKRDRAMFSLNILKATQKQREVEGIYGPMIEANLQKRAEMEANAGDEVLENAQNDQLQQNLLDDLNQEEVLDNSQAERDYHANFEIGPDEEVEEPEIE